MSHTPLTPPAVNPAIPPGTVPGERRTSWNSLLDKPTTLAGAGITGAGGGGGSGGGGSGGVFAGPLELSATGTPPLTLTRTEGGAALWTLLKLKRHSTVIGYLAVDASDRFALVAADGVTVLAFLEGTGTLDALLGFKAPHIEGTTDVKALEYLDSAGDRVVTTRQLAVADAVYIPGVVGATAVGTIPHAAGNPPTKAEFDAAVDQINSIVLAQATNGSAINNLVTMMQDTITQLDELLARVRASTGHGLIA